MTHQVDRNGQKLAKRARKLAAMHAMNSADWGRIEVALASVLVEMERDRRAGEDNIRASRSFMRTLDKVQRVNETGDHTIQADGRPLREHRAEQES